MNMIPAKYYLSNEGREIEEEEGIQKLSKEDEKLWKRHEVKQAKRAKLDPEQNESTSEIMKKTRSPHQTPIIRSKKDVKDTGLERAVSVDQTISVDSTNVQTHQGDVDSAGLSLDELRARLRMKIEEIRSKRTPNERHKQAIPSDIEKKSRIKKPKISPSHSIPEKKTASSNEERLSGKLNLDGMNKLQVGLSGTVSWIYFFRSSQSRFLVISLYLSG